MAEYGSVVDNAGVWSGKPQKGAILQIWHDPSGNWSNGHSQIFDSYSYDSKGNINGINIYDNKGSDNLPRDDYENKETILGVNLIDPWRGHLPDHNPV